MPRTARIIVKGEEAVYHIISRTALDGLPFNSQDKDKFVSILKYLSKIYFAEILGYTILDNHFHILARMKPGSDYSDKDIKKRFEYKYGTKVNLEDSMVSFYRDKWSKLSDFIKEIKQAFSVYYNRSRNRRGTLLNGFLYLLKIQPDAC